MGPSGRRMKSAVFSSTFELRASVAGRIAGWKRDYRAIHPLPVLNAASFGLSLPKSLLTVVVYGAWV